jgi:DNA-binding GntR family transcriptional regulator
MIDETAWTLSAPSNRVLSEYIAEQLREAIVTDQLKAGQRIVEREIAEAMQTSRGPVRDALLLLENEGLVVRYAHRGTFVAELTVQDIEEIYSLRRTIESLALEYLVKRATPEQLDQLDDLVQQMADKVEAGYRLAEATELDLAFHRALCRLSGHSRALAAWEALSGQTRILLLGHRIRNPRDFQERSVEWHRRLVNAVRERDLSRAQDELRRHLAATVEGLLEAEPESQGQDSVG